MAITYTVISTVTVGSGGASSIDFNSIPSSYTDLLIKTSLRSNSSAGTGLNIGFNGSTSSFTNKAIQGNGASASSFGTYNRFAGQVNMSTDTTNSFSSNEIYIPNYTNSINKSYFSDGTNETNSATAYMSIIAGLWSDTTAITSISLTSMNGTFVQYSSATLYGIKKD